MKKLILAAWITVIGFGVTAQEQVKQQKTPEELATKRVSRLKTELVLSASQEEVIKAALVTKMTKAKEVREKYAGDQEALKNAMEPIRTDFQNTMKTNLTEEQYAKWKEMLKKRGERAKSKRDALQRKNIQEKHEIQEKK